MIDPAGALASLILGMLEKQASTLSVSFPCRVLSYDSETGMTVVQPLLKSSDSVDPAPIQNVPALGQRFTVDGVERLYRPSLRAGDTVLVVCSDQEIQNVLGGVVAVPDSNRRHSHNDAVIVGVFPCSLQS